MNTLAERSVLYKFSCGLPGKHRKDKKTTAEVKMARALGDKSGNWVTDLWEENALRAISTKQGEARAYHDKVTFPFGSRSEDDDEASPAIAGVGILPAGLIAEYADKMRQFKGEMDKLVEVDFLASPRKYIDWAIAQHNGTFNPKNYPGCSIDAAGVVQLDEDVFRAKMRKKFYMTWEPLPVPDKEQFTASITALLGTDADSVNQRIGDATIEAQRELMRRLTQPVAHMAYRLAGKLCECSECKSRGNKTDKFKDTLVTNLQDIVALAPKMNITGDPQIDAFVREMDGLTRYAPDTLRSDAGIRQEAADKASAMLARLSGYKL